MSTRPRIPAAATRITMAQATRMQQAPRMAGRRLQARRLKVWSKNPHCAGRGKLVEFNDIPGRGFQLDNTKALKADGGTCEDVESNTQVLCCGPSGCHAKKTAKDMGYQMRQAIGLDGWPIDPNP